MRKNTLIDRKVSDEFIKVATDEIKSELEEIKNLLESCSSDSDILKNAESFQKNIHKIKGLAPMMGKKDLGDIASLDDILLKKLISGNQIPDILHIISESYDTMTKLLTQGVNDQALKIKIKTKYAKFLA